jgi:hypothetical protein
MSTLAWRLSRLESSSCTASDEDDRAAEALVRIERGRPAIDDYRWAFDLTEYRRYLLALTGLAAVRETLVQPDGDDVPDFQHLLRVIAFPPGRPLPGRVRDAWQSAEQFATAPLPHKILADDRISLGVLLAALGPDHGAPARRRAWTQGRDGQVSTMAARLSSVWAFPLRELDWLAGVRVSSLIGVDHSCNQAMNAVLTLHKATKIIGQAGAADLTATPGWKLRDPSGAAHVDVPIF